MVIPNKNPQIFIQNGFFKDGLTNRPLSFNIGPRAFPICFWGFFYRGMKDKVFKEEVATDLTSGFINSLKTHLIKGSAQDLNVQGERLAHVTGG